MEMSEIKKVDTSNYVKSGKVEVDGMIWTVTLPGAATELKLSKVQRRIKLLEKKFEKGVEEEKDLDDYDKYEDYMFNFFREIFKDSTKDNSQVNKWIDETPFAVIIQAFEDIKEQANESDPTN